MPESDVREFSSEMNALAREDFTFFAIRAFHELSIGVQSGPPIGAQKGPR